MSSRAPGSPRSLFEPSDARYLSRAAAHALTDRVLAVARADETRVTLNSGARGNTRFAVNQVSTAGDNVDLTVTVHSRFGKRSGVVTTNRLDDGTLRTAVQNAERLAHLAPDDPEAIPELGPQQYAEGQGWNDATANLEPVDRANAIRLITDPAKTAGFISTGYLEVDAKAFCVANSNGLFAYDRSTDLSLTTTVRTADGTGSGWAGVTATNWKDVNPSALGARATEKAHRSANPVAVEPGRYTVILEPTAVGNLVQRMAFAMDARSADEGRSFFSAQGGNKIGSKVVDERISLVSDPLDPAAPASPFSEEGLPLSRTAWIENGIVRNLAYDRFWALRKNHPPTPFIRSIHMSGGTASIDELVASTARGILVTRFWYIRAVDPRTMLYTGLTRDGTFLIERGQVTRAIRNLRFNESPVFMLNNIEALGRPERVSASENGGPGVAIVVPPIKVRDVTFTSLSDAV